jgi:hypothetical protein
MNKTQKKDDPMKGDEKRKTTAVTALADTKGEAFAMTQLVKLLNEKSLDAPETLAKKLDSKLRFSPNTNPVDPAAAHHGVRGHRSSLYSALQSSTRP